MIFVLGNTVGTIHDDFSLLVEQALVFGLLVALGVCDGRDLKLVHLPQQREVIMNSADCIAKYKNHYISKET